MTGRNSLRAALLSSCALLFPVAALAQTTGEAEALGTIILDTKRDVATDTGVAVTTIDQAEMDDRQASTIAELISSVPGVTLINGATPLGGGINIRGFGAGNTYGTNQKVLITIDGATQGSEELYRIGTQLFTDPELFKSVSVMRGTIGSFEYGSGVVGGIVQLETKDASDFTGGEIGYKLRQGLSFNSNGDGITSSTILAWQPSENAEFVANYIWRRLGEQVDGNGVDLGAEGFKTPSWGLKGKFTFGQERDQFVSLSLANSTMAERDVPYDAIGGNAFGNVDRDVESRNAVLTYGWNPLDNDLVDLRVILSYADQQIDSTSVPYVPTDGLRNADHRYETTKLTVKNTARFTFGSIENELRAGVEFIRKDRKTASSAPGGTDDRTAFFLINKFDFGNGLTITPAMRYETQDITYKGLPQARIPVTNFDNDALMGGVDVRYEFANGAAVFGSVAYTEGLPILDDFENQNQAWVGGSRANYMTINEQSRTVEIGASWRTADLFSAGDAFSIKGNIYDTNVWNATSEPSTAWIAGTGFELEAAYSMESGYYGELSTSIVNFESKTIQLVDRPNYAQTPPNSVRVVAGKRWDRELDLSWEMVAYDRYDESVIRPGFAVHNLRATYRPQEGVLEGTEIRFGVENLFDRDYMQALATRNGPGRNFKVGIIKTF
ncbi:TonB-dependent receptor plug domain-containing protein [Pseudomonas sp. GX19020]|uniref:TonB-dependent receptor plug domain-containing protein n=1 Tax=Pseudomonas sp. GX19020 TaxID=2942277 RepID=UPI00201949C6|nr:TonB-dependent receptor plug domain-containing protein [Pseudomonas sp. GX19020]MCL4068611.1 TonB-dependent receptor plug domain-containing protein [Pseudomonas sp. GX19020]